jgi:hypothetical protein
MHAECQFKAGSTEERQGRAIVIVGVAITLVTLLLLIYGLMFHG